MRFSLRSLLFWFFALSVALFWVTLLLHDSSSSHFFSAMSWIGVPLWCIPVWQMQRPIRLRVVYFLVLLSAWLSLAAYGEVLLVAFHNSDSYTTELFHSADQIVARLIAIVFALPALLIATLLYRAWIYISNESVMKQFSGTNLDDERCDI